MRPVVVVVLIAVGIGSLVIGAVTVAVAGTTAPVAGITIISVELFRLRSRPKRPVRVCAGVVYAAVVTIGASAVVPLTGLVGSGAGTGLGAGAVVGAGVTVVVAGAVMMVLVLRRSRSRANRPRREVVVDIVAGPDTTTGVVVAGAGAALSSA
jgi:hypothetical protein